MPRCTTATAPLFFATAADFRAWLINNSSTAPELVVGLYKAGSGRPSMSWPESVDEALCVGWIDGVRKRIDDQAYQIRFSRRKKDSVWSSVNIAKAKALLAEGRMLPAGRVAFEQRTERRSSVYAYEQQGALTLAANEIASFRKNRIAWTNFESLPPGYRKTMVYWVVSAKQPATRARRLSRFIASCAAGERQMP